MTNEHPPTILRWPWFGWAAIAVTFAVCVVFGLLATRDEPDGVPEPDAIEAVPATTTTPVTAAPIPEPEPVTYETPGHPCVVKVTAAKRVLRQLQANEDTLDRAIETAVVPAVQDAYDELMHMTFVTFSPMSDATLVCLAQYGPAELLHEMQADDDERLRVGHEVGDACAADRAEMLSCDSWG